MKENIGISCELSADRYLIKDALYMYGWDDIVQLGKMKTEVKLQLIHYVWGGGNTTLYLKKETCVVQSTALLSGCSEGGRYFKGGCNTDTDGTKICMWPSNSTLLEERFADTGLPDSPREDL